MTETIELMVAVRPNFHHPALFAKAAANIDRIAGGRLALNVVSSWWADEAKQYGLQFDQHDDRYARTDEWLQVVDGLWTEERFSFAGQFYQTEEAICAPKPAKRPTVYAGGESEKAKAMIARAVRRLCHARRSGRRRSRPRSPTWRRGARRPAARRCSTAWPPMRSSATARRRRKRELERITTVSDLPAGYANFDQWLSGTQLEREMKIQEYSVSNRGLRPNLVGTPEQLRERIAEYEAAGLDLLLLQAVRARRPRR